MLASWEDMEILDHFNFEPKNLFARFTSLSYIKWEVDIGYIGEEWQ